MNSLESALRRIPGDMRKVNVRWALVGGFAVSTYAGGRATVDIDVALALDSDSDIDRVVFQLTGLGYQPGVVLEDAETGKAATVRMFAPGPQSPGIYVDLLVNTSGIEGEVVAAARPRVLRPGIEMPVASLGHLLALKSLSERDDRLQDRIDLQNLLTVASSTDIALAYESADLITERARARNKDLRATLDRYIALAKAR